MVTFSDLIKNQTLVKSTHRLFVYDCGCRVVTKKVQAYSPIDVKQIIPCTDHNADSTRT